MMVDYHAKIGIFSSYPFADRINLTFFFLRSVVFSGGLTCLSLYMGLLCSKYRLQFNIMNILNCEYTCLIFRLLDKLMFLEVGKSRKEKL
jgi:hypothetical protein